MEFEGIIFCIKDLETFGSGFKKRSLVIVKPGKYPNYLEINFTGEKVDLLDGYNVGDEVRIETWDLKGRLWSKDENAETKDKKCFMGLDARQIELLQPSEPDEFVEQIKETPF